jgi:ribosomal protein uL24
MPIHRDDEVLIIRGEQKGREGKVIAVYRKKYKVHVEKISIDKINGMCDREILSSDLLLDLNSLQDLFLDLLTLVRVINSLRTNRIYPN